MGRGAMAHNHKFPLILPPPGGLNAPRYSEIVLPKLKEYEEILSAEIDQMLFPVDIRRNNSREDREMDPPTFSQTDGSRPFSSSTSSPATAFICLGSPTATAFPPVPLFLELFHISGGFIFP
ncbi:hypothetical protein TREMEDRAFT_58057 [Tremella mesenterica DSM 1558]|uniref:uncharacterized protein n=1 Tax=Tremella mesenterica (strain ATCC 24925 / CBS 8224 / DSM 1558 / NBRC 9311 / NRRL Y-6157 / RJB 2259-6 / UBC 559-6) TaxID=578456 RepID=UPI0003F49599|nr:uncharacterized protein TREMEDRAFT_58057 [Tremella mesenterica DSM 1558]EIW71921.1 hypothetical protein TREMEDRAFT_58057 [Tremella mesenterica DSM 1558]